MSKKGYFKNIVEVCPLPSSVDLEEQILADMLFLPQCVATVKGIVSAEMFSDPECASVWSTLCKMHDDGQIIELVSFCGHCNEEMRNRIIARAEMVGTELTVPAHCKALSDAHTRREAYKFALNVIAKSSDKSIPTEELYSIPEDFAKSVQAIKDLFSDTIQGSEAFNELADNLELKSKGKSIKVQTGFDVLDRILYGGFNAGNLAVLAARPSVGKTAVMLQMAKAAALSGIPSLVFSLEMENVELAQRLLLSFGTISGKEVANGNVDWNEFEKCVRVFDGVPLYLNDKETRIDGIISRILLEHQQRRCGIAFIDYLGLIDTNSGSQAPLHQVIASITRKLKRVAKKCGIPIVLLCQLNRASVSEGRPPMLNDLRDSGSIEQDADIVLMLESSTVEDRPMLKMWVRKNRQGKAGMYILLKPNGTYTQFIPESVCL